ncbi:MAG: GTP-binding protein [Neisseria sp.]|nr:GTP-binding protein [Neisseria sp.]
MALFSSRSRKNAVQAASNTPQTTVHLFSGFLGTGKTTLIKSLMAQKDPAEKWVIIVNEFGEIGIDGAVLSDSGVPVAEVAGGCLCCTAGAQMSDTVRKMLREKPQRMLIEASGLAHAAGVIDDLRALPEKNDLTIGATFTLVDPRQFTDDAYAKQPLYRDQVSVADVLVTAKSDLCDEGCLKAFHVQAAALFPPKSMIVATAGGKGEIAWLDAPVTAKSRYRVAELPDNSMGFRTQGYTFPAETQFDGDKITSFFNDLPQLCEGLVRAKGVFRVLDTWVWLNWTDGQWGASQVAWRRDNRFELIAKDFDEENIAQRLQAACE